MQPDVLFIFAHQDDEVGCVTRIAFERAAGNRVWCLYLTDGSTNAPAATRDAESLAALARLGVAPSRVVFLADGGGRLPSHVLHQSLDRALRMVLGWIAATGVSPNRIFVPDWEGGHHDHDAAHLVALAVGREFRVPVFAYSMYNAWRRPKGFFRVASFVPDDAPVLARRLSFREALQAATFVLAYPSQRRTWLGLGPGFAWRMLVRRTERIRSAGTQRVLRRPHAGALLYETMFSVPSDEVLAVSEPLRRAIATPPASQT